MSLLTLSQSEAIQAAVENRDYLFDSPEAAKKGWKMDEEKVVAIRSSTDSNKELAQRYGLKPRAVRAIRNGKTWKGVE